MTRNSSQNQAPSGQLNTWQEKLAARAKIASETERSAGGSGSAWISLMGGHITIDDAVVPDDTLDLVVLDSILENQFYARPFNPNVPDTPACFAFARDAKIMRHHMDSPEPQCEGLCQTCPKAQWNSSLTGKGKACKEVRRLAVIVAGEADDALNAEVRLVKLPVTSVSEWSGYVQHLAQVQGIPPEAAVTRLYIEQTPGKMPSFRVRFKFVEKLDEGLLNDIYQRQDLIQEELLQPYTPVVQDPPQPSAPAKYVPKTRAR